MTGPPAAWPATQLAPSVSRAQQSVMVRMHDGELAGRVSIEFAERLLTSGAAQRIGREKLRYVRLVPGIVMARSSSGWDLIEKERRKYGDTAVRRGIMACDRCRLKWAPVDPPASAAVRPGRRMRS